MQVLVTGGAGFIGSNFVHYLAASRPQWKITVLDALTYAGNLENLAGLLAGEKIEFVRGDIADSRLVGDLFAQKKFQLVFHFAAESHVDRSILSAAEFVRTNVLGTEALLSAALSAKTKRFVHVSTDEVYGSLGPSGSFHESTPLDPTSPYAASKAASDLLVLAFVKTHGLDAVVTRCSNNYGPYQFPEKLIPLFVTNAMEDRPLPLYGDGMNVRSWLYVEDHCEALLLTAEKASRGDIFNIGGASESEVPNIEVTKSILSILGKPQSLIQKVGDRPAHDRRYSMDYSRLEKALGWKPRTGFEQGLRRTVDWYRNNEAWWRKVKSGEYLKYYEQNYAGR